jgi:RNA:NAD 2'-phosphotransferase (TPT1/KptA family)
LNDLAVCFVFIQVTACEKGRFEMIEGPKPMIRATQGHSTKGIVDEKAFARIEVTDFFFHLIFFSI